MSIILKRFQREFIKAATSPDVDTAALSLPRGNGKSWLAGHLVTRVLSPDDVLFRPGTESVLCAASIEQARIVFRFAREDLEDTGAYRFLDSNTRIGITHKTTNTRLRVIGSNGKTAMGLVNTPWAVCDEPGAWEVNGGTLLHDAIQTAMGKPGSPLRAVYIGTLAPATGGWWHDMVNAGTRGSTYVQALQGDAKRWDVWAEIARVNPLVRVDAKFKAKLLEERDAARRDSRLKARFLSYRLNRPTADEAVMLLNPPDLDLALARELPAAKGRPIVGVDLGGGRAWSAAVACYPTGRVEALAVAPGLPSIESQERRDMVPAGTYKTLLQGGSLRLAEGLRVPPVSTLTDAAVARWGRPASVVCDAFRLNELRDALPGVRIEPRRTRWSESSEDIRALRKLTLDGPLAVAPEARQLLTASLSAALVSNDTSGNVRLVKKDPHNNTGRDDVAAALVLAAGELARRPVRRGPSIRVIQ